jgi:hypothetical protein
MLRKTSLALKIFLGLSFGSAAIVLLLSLWLVFAPDRWVYRQQFKTSELIVNEAEAFRNIHGRVPEERELASLMQKYGWKHSEECPCYQALSGLSYMVWFGYETLGTSMVYRSENKTWDYEG